MEVINITLDVNKMRKCKQYERSYESKNGHVDTAEFKLVVVPLKEKKFLSEGTTNGRDWKRYKTHFVAEKKDKGEEPNYVGQGVMFENKSESLDF